MHLNLSPWNSYILIAAIVLLVVFLFLTLMKALQAVKVLSEMKPALDHLQKEVTLMQIKTTVLAEKSAADKKRNDAIIKAIPILLAVKHAYDANDTYTGATGYLEAAKSVMNERSAEKKLISKIKKAL